MVSNDHGRIYAPRVATDVYLCCMRFVFSYVVAQIRSLQGQLQAAGLPIDHSILESCKLPEIATRPLPVRGLYSSGDMKMEAADGSDSEEEDDDEEEEEESGDEDVKPALTS